MIINDLDDYYIVFDTKNRNTELDTLLVYCHYCIRFIIIRSNISTKLDAEACKNSIYALWHSFFYALLAF